MLRNLHRIPHILSICLAAFLIYGEASPTHEASAPICRELKAAGSLTAPSLLSWITPENGEEKEKPDKWCATVGPALFRAPDRPRPQNNGRIFVVGWNLHVGNANIEALINDLKSPVVV